MLSLNIQSSSVKFNYFLYLYENNFEGNRISCLQETYNIASYKLPNINVVSNIHNSTTYKVIPNISLIKNAYQIFWNALQIKKY